MKHLRTDHRNSRNVYGIHVISYSFICCNVYFAYTSVCGRVPRTVCFILILCALWPAGILSPFVLHTPHSFFSVSFEAQSVSPHSYIKSGRTADFSHQVYLIEQLHISLSCHCMWIKAAAQSFFVARQHQGYLFCLVECKVNRRNCKALAQLWCRWAAWTTDRGREGATTASCGEKEKLEAKGRWSKGSRELGDKEQTEAWSCKGNKRKREWDRVGVGRTESESRDRMDWWM